ncbi:uncharacterized protein LOC122719039 [Apis laboriosa]|uniref:uncharacterized protein LOC122719039 n=1 Tax=Apis laboriosa TaxID=183418 RepID=UPI001CC3D44A|nr:uncharacterized protein LOC122719039 [Apis laboriosa]
MWINRRQFRKQNSPLIVKAQFIIICVCILLEIYLYALPADYMYHMSMNISRSVYDSIWYEQRLDLQKALLTVLAFQKPIPVSINVLLPELTIRYYCSYVSNALSIFAALRTVVDDS